ncbi:inositol 2-dehydrogenase [Paenibacillus cellulositrophicus]|uniref:inositol 2-dehydrogenase n=1 Tax=Paenibacillus cellulositrophicus TaxID=562959 RepID=UPI002041C330|nr:inositol 2-dehydrogenase [Paenibacillus cellulositrophicus]MCM2998038.1 inositol 2-dehydrogenase [Paenibacillus cellulositrophicus]
MSKQLNIGVIGAGRIGRLHTENLLNHPQVKVKAIADLQIDHARAWANGLGIPLLTQDAEQIISDPGIDAVFICTSTNTHIDMIERSAKAGKHIFCEKPISFDVRGTRLALQAASDSGVKFQLGFNRRFDPNFRRVREIVASGQIGDPHLIKITSRDPSPPPHDYIKVSGGLFMDMAIHDFDMARFLSGSEVDEVYVQGAVLVDPTIGELGDVDTAVIMLRFRNGAIGVIDNSRQAAYGYDQRVEVFGSLGQVNVQNDFPNSAEISTAGGVYRDKPKHFFLERYEAAYRLEIESFIKAIVNNEDVPVSGEDGYQAELLADAARKSWLEKRPVSLSEYSMSTS